MHIDARPTREVNWDARNANIGTAQSMHINAVAWPYINTRNLLQQNAFPLKIARNH